MLQTGCFLWNKCITVSISSHSQEPSSEYDVRDLTKWFMQMMPPVCRYSMTFLPFWRSVKCISHLLCWLFWLYLHKYPAVAVQPLVLALFHLAHWLVMSTVWWPHVIEWLHWTCLILQFLVNVDRFIEEGVSSASSYTWADDVNHPWI